MINIQNSRCNSTNTTIAEYTIQYMHTWILKDECVATYIAPIWFEGFLILGSNILELTDICTSPFSSDH